MENITKGNISLYAVPVNKDYDKIFGNINISENLSSERCGSTCSTPPGPCFFCTCASCDHGLFVPPNPIIW
jgi:hypothetical protein